MTVQNREMKTEKSELNIKKHPAIFWMNSALMISGVAAAVVTVAMSAAIFKSLNANMTLAQLMQGIETHSSQSQDGLRLATKNIAQLQQVSTDMIDTLKAQEKTLVDLRQSTFTSKDDLRTAEAQYLIKLANINLQFENNTARAIRLLQTADQVLGDTTDARLFAVRKAVTTDLAALQNSSDPDITQLYLRLSAINSQVDKLPLAKVEGSVKTADEKEAIRHLSWWKRGLYAVQQALQQVVVLHKNQSGTLPFVTPEQQQFLYQNLQSEIEKAEWALMQRQSDIYHASLQQAVDWIKQYVDPSAEGTEKTLAELTALQQMNINPTTLTVAASLQAFQEYNLATQK